MREDGTLSFAMSVCPSVSTQNTRIVKQNFIKFDTGVSNLKFVNSFQFLLKSGNDNGHYTKKYARIYAQFDRNFLNMSSSSSFLTDKVLWPESTHN
jgi:hypothetical protein